MSRVVRAARGWLGTPYVHGASVRGGGTDCLGLIRGVWREVMGAEPVEVPTYTADWSEPQGDEVLLRTAGHVMTPLDPEAALAGGQVLLFRMRESGVAKHLGIVSDAGAAPRFVHAYSGWGVVETSLSTPWARRVVARFLFPSEE